MATTAKKKNYHKKKITRNEINNIKTQDKIFKYNAF